MQYPKQKNVKATVPKYLAVKNIYFLINPPYNYLIHMFNKMLSAIFSIFTGNTESNNSVELNEKQVHEKAPD